MINYAATKRDPKAQEQNASLPLTWSPGQSHFAGDFADAICGPQTVNPPGAAPLSGVAALQLQDSCPSGEHNRTHRLDIASWNLIFVNSAIQNIPTATHQKKGTHATAQKSNADGAAAAAAAPSPPASPTPPNSPRTSSCAKNRGRGPMSSAAARAAAAAVASTRPLLSCLRPCLPPFSPKQHTPPSLLPRHAQRRQMLLLLRCARCSVARALARGQLLQSKVRLLHLLPRHVQHCGALL